MAILAERIKLLRESRKMTQLRLSIELQVAQETISGYEIGRITPPADMLIKLASCLNTSTDYLLGRTDDMSPLIFGKHVNDIETQMIFHFRRLSQLKQERVLGYIEALENDI